ncbi:PAS-domain containing protein [Paracoccus sp. (in: a-proteobacteria)]|uniref:PAS-domain containing protein n=1 Tax=Paracoccus sp. TaxID=267 RepID=UPI0026DEB97B|nr:PAS-domain containing protein [Paracoccus sp. (in: a-proteobacteria)]MDO5648337.1 PAS-domain containing protein [Paracoccus sp. (in: a-proteobacteria)]
MDIQGLLAVMAVLAAGAGSTLLAIVVIRLWDTWRQTGARAGGGLVAHLQPMIFLFRGQRLIDATTPAHNLLQRLSHGDSDWVRLTQWLGPHFGDLDTALAGLAQQGRVVLRGERGNGAAQLRLVAEQLDPHLIRLTLTSPDTQDAGITVDSMTLQAMEEELDHLRSALDQAPILVWRQDHQGQIVWANSAYLKKVETSSGASAAWPLPRLLDQPTRVPGAGTTTRRAPLDDNGTVFWYDCHSQPLGDQTMFFALPADAAVRAERSLREFVQTLTKTFADLPIGLAIFDRQRNLQLFNPALIDLTGLPTGFLVGRPTLIDFLDQLREQRMVPEPKDYRSWRQQMANLESAASIGHHVETWSLPGGQTYRVTGRPHPDGAIAFLFEDITSEMSLTRKFRAELTLGAHVLDGIDDGVVVFGNSGELVMSNRSYRDLWGGDAATITETLKIWQSVTADGPGLAALRECLTGNAPQGNGSGAMSGPSGELLGWSVTQLSAGRRMVRFRLPTAQALTAIAALPLNGVALSPRPDPDIPPPHAALAPHS